MTNWPCLFLRLLRAKPIDLLAKYIAQQGVEELDDEAMDTVEMHEPYTYLNGLALEDLEDLLAGLATSSIQFS